MCSMWFNSIRELQFSAFPDAFMLQNKRNFISISFNAINRFMGTRIIYTDVKLPS